MKHKLFLILLLVFFVISALFFLRKNFNKPSSFIAAADFEVKATVEDSTGVDPESEFIIKSKSPLDIKGIKENLEIKPVFAYDLKAVNDREIKIKPKEKLTEGKVYRFNLAKTEEVRTGGVSFWSFGIKTPFKIVTTLPRDGATNVPLNTGIEVTFSFDGFEDPNNYFEITPSAEGRLERHKRVLVFVPKALNHSTLYTVKLKKGLGLTDSSEELKEDTVFQFETEPKSNISQEPHLGFTKDLNQYPLNEKPAFGLYISDFNLINKLAVNIYRYKNDGDFLTALKRKETLPFWAKNSRESFLSDTKALDKVTSFEAPLQQLDYTGYFIFPEVLPEGYYLVEVKASNRKEMLPVQSFLQITNTAAYLNSSKTKTLIWVLDLNSKKPLDKVEVELVDGNVKEQTSSNGISQFATPVEILNSKKRNFYRVTASGKTIIIPADPEQSFYSFYDRFDNPGSKSEDYWSYLYFDRPLYQPKDSVSFWGMVKRRDDNNKEVKYKAVLSRSDYIGFDSSTVSLWESDLKLSEMNTFTGEIPINSYQPGYYSLTVYDGDTNVLNKGFSVQTYTKPAYKISVEPSKKAVFAGETVEFAGKTSFFEGTPVANVSLKYNISGNREEEIRSDKTGQFSVKYIPEFKDPQINQYPRYDYINISPKNAEEGEIEGATQVMVFGSRIQFKVKGIASKEKGNLSIALFNIDLSKINSPDNSNSQDFLGNPSTRQQVMGKIYENSWQEKVIGEYYDFISKTTGKKYQYLEIKNLLTEINLTTDEKGEAVFEFPVKEKMHYEAELEAKDENGKPAKVKLFIYPQGESSGYQEENYYHLETDREIENRNFSLGEKVNLTMLKGKQQLKEFNGNYYLFLLSQRGLKDFKVNESPNFDFTFADDFVPNILAKAIYFDGITFHESDTLNLPFKRDDRQLTVKVETDKESYRPADKVNLNIETVDKSGQPTEAEVNLSLVDESLFQLEEQYVDILGELYRYVSSGTLVSYASHQYPAAKVMAEGGGCFVGGTNILMQENIKLPIEKVKTGDYVLTRESPNSSRLIKAKVIKTYRHEAGDYLIFNGSLKVTAEHNLFVNGRWMIAGDARIGDYLLDINNNWVRIFAIEKRKVSINVYNLEIEKLGTYFAGNFYVHNQKGRDLFKDKAFFESVVTDKTGKGNVSFSLPDNLTSWRATYQAINDNLSAGNGNKLIPVKLPFFVDLVANNEYLVGDRPVIKIRSYGESIGEQSNVDYSFQSETLKVAENSFQAKAFEEYKISLPPLTEGSHKLTLTGKSGNFSDKLIREIKVVKSRFNKAESDFQSLTQETKIKGSDKEFTTVVLTDNGIGKFYYPLINLSFNFGSRVDQKAAEIMSKQLLNSNFAEKTEVDEFDFSMYQQNDGGISLFPYSSSETLLSAKIAQAAGNLFSKEALKQYFFKILDGKNETVENLAAAYYGLAALDEPVLIQAKRLLATSADLKLNERLLLGLSLALSGDGTGALNLYKDIINKYGESYKPYYRINSGSDQDDILETTSLACNLAGLLNQSEAELMFKYLEANYTKDILINLEKLLYVN
ncbi:hypothetical protein A2W14_00890, partial [Candidatus Gottesmanbacteria bacterium RBG_16_37_8]